MKWHRTHPVWDNTPPEIWHTWQTRRLRHYLATRVLPHSSHYRSLFAEHDFEPGDLHTLEDWSYVPMTSKSDLTVPPDQQRGFALIPDPATLRREPETIFRAMLKGPSAAKAHAEHEFRPVMLTSTTGRSSEPVPFLYTKHDLNNLEIAGRRMMEVGASQQDFRHVNLFPYAPHLAFWQAHHAGLGFNTFMVSSGGGKTLGTEGNMKLIDRIRPEVVIGMPTFIYHLLLQAVASGRKWPQLKRLVLGGEKVADGLRARLLELTEELGSTRCVVIGTYGFTEAKMAFPECPVEDSKGGSGYHISPDLGIFELIDPKTGTPVSEGESGEIVFTPLDARGTVVLRYRTGDIAEGGLSWEPCPHCGRRTPRLIGPISRASEYRELHLDKLKGTLVNFNLLEHLLDDQRGIAAWQIELRKRNNDPHETDEVHLHVAAESGINPDNLRTLVRRRFREVTELTPNSIDFHDLTDLRDRLGVGRLLTEEKLVDHRPKEEPVLTA